MMRLLVFPLGAATVVAAGLLGLGGPAAAAPAAPPATAAAAAVGPGIGIRLLDAPSDRRNDPRAQAYIVDHVHPGAHLSRRIEVSNGTASPAVLNLYADAARIPPTGFEVLDGHASNELTGWSAVSPGQLRLPPGGHAEATVDITVPSDASPGERYAAILAELPPAQPAGGSAGPVALISRVGIRVYLDVGTGGEPASAFGIATLTAARGPDGVPAVRAQVTKTGGRALDLAGVVDLTDGPGGLRAGPFAETSVRTLGVGEHGDVVVPLDRALPAGPWTVTLTMRSGLVQQQVTGRLTFPATAGATAQPVRAKAVPLAHRKSVVGVLAAIFAGIVALGLLLIFWRRRRHDGDPPQPSKTGPVVDPSPAVQGLRR